MENGIAGKRMNPYKGLSSYEEADETIFKGRDTEKEELFRNVTNNSLTVVYGESGAGKTSLLNAGLFPLFRRSHCLPIKMRLNYSAPDLIGQAKYLIRTGLGGNNIIEKVSNSLKDKTLWEYFNNNTFYQRDNGGEINITPILVFDQFEEIFTIGKDHPDCGNWIKELADLFDDQLPDQVRRRILEKNAEIPQSNDSHAFRVIISLRQEYLTHLYDLKISSTDKLKYRVRFLNGRQAREIIRAEFKEEADMDAILHQFYPPWLKSNIKLSDEELSIAPTFLSVICQQMYQSNDITPIIRKTPERILEEFYYNVMKTFPQRVETYIGDKLLTDDGYRIPSRLDQGYDLKPYVEELLNRRVLRKDHWGDGDYIEITHDILIPIIKKKREQRDQRAKKIAIMLLLILLGFFTGVTALAIYQKYRADEAQGNVREMIVTSKAIEFMHDDNTRAVRIAEIAYNIDTPPQPRTSQVLSTIGYSSLIKPFYITTVIHNGPVSAAIFSSNDQDIITASEDKTAKIWTMDGHLKRVLEGHEDKIISVVPSPSGTQIITISWDKTARLWNLQGNGSIKLSHDGPVTCAAFSENENYIVTGSRDGTAKLWDKQGNFIALMEHKASISSVAISPDEQKVLTASWDRTAKIWDMNGKFQYPLPHDGAVTMAQFSPDGQTVLTASWDNHAKLWRLQKNKYDPIVDMLHINVVSFAKFSPDGSKILTVSLDNIPRIWDTVGNQLAELTRHPDEISSAVFSSDSSKVLVASLDGTVNVSELDGRVLATIKQSGGKVYSAQFSADSQKIITACEDGTAKVWNLKNDVLVNLNNHTADVNSAEFSPDGSLIVTASNDHTAKLWKSDGAFLNDLGIHNGPVSKVLFSHTGEKIITLVSRFEQHMAKVWDKKGILLADLPHSDVITYASFSLDDTQLVTATEEGRVRIWSMANVNNTPINLRIHQDLITSVMFSPDGQSILTASNDGTAKVCDLKGKPRFTLKHEEKKMVYYAEYSLDGSRIITASQDGTAKLWDQKGNWIETLRHNGPVTYAKFSPNGQFIVTASSDKTAKLWDTKGKLLKTLVEHTQGLSLAMFSPNSQRILTVAEDKIVKYWNLEGELLANLNLHKGAIHWACFSPDGKRILTASEDTTAKVWMTPEAIAEWLKTANIPKLSTEEQKMVELQ